MRNAIDFKLSENKSKSRLLPKVLFKEDPICVIDLAEIKDLDKDNLLPHKGSLVFYYDMKSNATGHNFLEDKKYYRVNYLENSKSFNGGYGLSFSSINSYPDSDDASMLGIKDSITNPKDFDLRVLGWPIVNDNQTLLLELNRRKFDLSKGFKDIAPYVMNNAKKETENWLLLLQINSIKNTLTIGDCGAIYFYIRKDDLANRDFSKVYMMKETC